MKEKGRVLTAINVFLQMLMAILFFVTGSIWISGYLETSFYSTRFMDSANSFYYGTRLFTKTGWVFFAVLIIGIIITLIRLIGVSPLSNPIIGVVVSVLQVGTYITMFTHFCGQIYYEDRFFEYIVFPAGLLYFYSFIMLVSVILSVVELYLERKKQHLDK